MGEDDGLTTDVDGTDEEGGRSIGNASSDDSQWMSSSESEYESSEPEELTAERIKERIAELRNNKRATKEWIKRVRRVARDAVDPHHADLTMEVIEEDARTWDEEIGDALHAQEGEHDQSHVAGRSGQVSLAQIDKSIQSQSLIQYTHEKRSVCRQSPG